MLTICEPKPEDAEAINEVMGAAWYATYTNNEIGVTKADIDAMYEESEARQIEAFRRRAANPKEDDISLIAKEGTTVVGFIRLKIHSESTKLLSLYVHPQHTGKGIGTRLWLAALKIVPPNMPITVELADYTKAKDFYEKMGFVDTGERFTKEEVRMEKSGTCLPLMKMILNTPKHNPDT